jgi:hypothetical protein
VFASGYTPNAVRRHVGLEHDRHLLAKPYTLEGLALAIRQAIDDSASA